MTAKVRIRNASRRGVEGAYGFVGIGKFEVPLDTPPNSSGYAWPIRVRGRSSVLKRITWEGGDTSTNLAGTRLSIRLACELPDANFADNTAESLQITPVYAPR